MLSIGQEEGPAMRSMVFIQPGEVRWGAPAGGHAVQTVAKAGRKDDGASASPASTAKGAGITHSDRPPAVHVNRFELAIGGKANEARVRRPEGAPGMLGAWQGSGVERIQRTHPQHGHAISSGSDKSEHFAIGRKRRRARLIAHEDITGFLRLWNERADHLRGARLTEVER